MGWKCNQIRPSDPLRPLELEKRTVRGQLPAWKLRDQQEKITRHISQILSSGSHINLTLFFFLFFYTDGRFRYVMSNYCIMVYVSYISLEYINAVNHYSSLNGNAGGTGWMAWNGASFLFRSGFLKHTDELQIKMSQMDTYSYFELQSENRHVHLHLSDKIL